MVLFKNSLDLKITKDTKRRFIYFKVDIQDTNFILLNCYAPNKLSDQIDYVDRIKLLMENPILEKDMFIAAMDTRTRGGFLPCKGC